VLATAFLQESWHNGQPALFSLLPVAYPWSPLAEAMTCKFTIPARKMQQKSFLPYPDPAEI